MAALACDLVVGHKCEVAQVLPDIPFISIGILVFSVSTLFLVIKRVALSVIFFFFSVLLLFVAALLDLGQTLVDGVTVSATPVAIKHVIQAREVLFSLSVGFRFLFYWSYVAEPPLKNLYAAAAQSAQKVHFPVFQSTHEPHSGSWMRWGLTGKLAATGLLVAIIIITSLQIVWRVVPRFHQYSNVYATDAALELLVSFLLLLKLLSNTIIFSGSADSMLVHAFGEHVAPVSGLLLNIGIGVGDLLRFAFTESMAGRLLQALEVYVIVVFVMVTAFLGHRDMCLPATSSQDTRYRDAVFTLPEPTRESTFRITLPLIETPRMSTVFGITTQNKEAGRQLPRRSALYSLNYVSLWLSSRMSRHRSRHDDEEVKLWDAERATFDPSTRTGSISTDRACETDTSPQAPKEHADGTSSGPMATMSALDAPSVIAKTFKDSQVPHVPRQDVPQRTLLPQVCTNTVPFSAPSSSISGTWHAETEVTPIYGLGGIQSLTRACDPLPKRHVETLGSFPAEVSASPSCSTAAQRPTSTQLTRSLSTSQKTVCSDVSLSNFPAPPWQTTPVPSLPPSSLPPIQRIRGDRRVLLAAARVQDKHALDPPRTLASLVDVPNSPRFNSIPHTPTGEESEPLPAEAEKLTHSDFWEKRYNVTSFIGGGMFAGHGDSHSDTFEGLATPGGSCQRSQEEPCWPVESESGSETRKLPCVLRRPEGLPDVMDQTTYSLTKPSLPVTERGEKDMSRSQLAQNVGSTGGCQRTYVRRKPARLAIQTYYPGASQVQVVVDD